MTAERRAAARIFIDYLLAKPQQEKALSYGFRPGSTDVAVDYPIDAAHGVDPKQPVTTLEIPPPDVIAAIEQQWDGSEKKPADIALVLDTSGSMQEDNKLTNAKAGAKQLVSLLGDKDDFSLLQFSDTASWATKDEALGVSRKASDTGIDSLFPAARPRSTMPSTRHTRTCRSGPQTISAP